MNVDVTMAVRMRLAIIDQNLSVHDKRSAAEAQLIRELDRVRKSIKKVLGRQVHVIMLIQINTCIYIYTTCKFL